MTNFGNNGTVSVIDTTTNTVVGNPIKVENGPSSIAHDPVNKRMYVTNFADGTFSVIDTTTNTVVGNPIRVEVGPFDIAYDPVNKRMYVTNFADGTVSFITLG